MSNIVRYPFFYIVAPSVASIILLFIFFNLPISFYYGILFFLFSILACFLFFGAVFKFKYKTDDLYKKVLAEKKYKFFISLFCFLIIICGGLDILVNGLKIINPSTYAEFNGWGRYVRHISILCWILIPVGFIFFGKSKIKLLFVTYAIIFPILIVDRNRLFSSFYVLIFCIFCGFSGDLPKGKKSNYRKIILLMTFLLLVFSIVGFLRSGAGAFVVESSGVNLVDGMLPLKDIFFYMPALFQQIILYVTTPLFNFATVFGESFANPDFLLSQLSPFNREDYDAYPYSPVLIPRFNVGTEFYPWFLWGGAEAAFFAIFFMVFSFFLSIKFLEKKPNIYTLLIFLKISYAILFMGFAPQFYILLNFSFFVLILILWFVSALLNLVKE